MPSAKLKSVEIRNWGTIREAKIDFPDRGLVLVSGPIGAGKTLLGEALCRALVGVKGRFTQVAHYACDDSGKNSYVKIEADRGEKPLVVELGYKCSELSSTGEGFRFTHDGKVVWRDVISSTREELIKILGVTPQLAEWVVFIDGGLNFATLSQKDAVDLVMASLATPPWSKYHKHALKVLEKFKKEETTAESAYNEAKRAVDTVTQDISDAEETLSSERSAHEKEKLEHSEKLQRAEDRLSRAREELKKKQDAVADKREEIKEITSKIRKLENDSAESYHQIEVKKQKINKKLSQARSFRQRRLDRIEDLKSNARAAERALQAMKDAPTSCPRCNRPWDARHSAQELSDQQAKINGIKERQKKFDALVSEAVADASTYNGQLNVLDEETAALGVRDKVKQLSEDCEDVEDEISALNRAIRTASDDIASMESSVAVLRQGPDASRVNRAEAVLGERKRQLKSAELRVDTSSASFSDAKEATKAIAYWVEGYGPTGIPNMILRDSVAPLNDIAKRISHIMTEGTLNVSFATTKTLASGEDRCQLSIKVDNKLGCKRAEGSSKGERGETNLIVAETFAEVGQVWNRVGFRWYDEVTGNFQPSTRRSLFSYLKELANKLGILIFIVDHHEEVQNYADHVLEVSKEGRVTSLAWKR